MAAPPSPPPSRRSRRPLVIAVTVVVLVAAVALAVTQINLASVGHTLAHAHIEWVLAGLALMGSSLFLRATSWIQVLRAALPTLRVPVAPVVRATMIGVMGSAVFPGRVGEAARVLLVSRRLDAPDRQMIPLVAGTVFSQTLINLGALTLLAIAALSGIPALHGRLGGLSGALIVPAVIALLLILGPPLLRLARRSSHPRLAHGAERVARVLALARGGMTVFASPRHGPPAVLAQLAAWVLQWLACWSLLLALSFHTHSNALTAAGVLLAVNVSAVLPATPSNVGVFQAACIVVLAAAGVAAGPALAYGILLQAVEVVTALGLGIPALLREGLSFTELRGGLRPPQDGAAAPAG